MERNHPRRMRGTLVSPRPWLHCTDPLGDLLCQASRVVRIGQEEDTRIAENIANNVVPQERTSRSVCQRHAEGGGPRGHYKETSAPIAVKEVLSRGVQKEDGC